MVHGGRTGLWEKSTLLASLQDASLERMARPSFPGVCARASLRPLANGCHHSEMDEPGRTKPFDACSLSHALTSRMNRALCASQRVVLKESKRWWA